jgi:probable phosphoglycerate mutase
VSADRLVLWRHGRTSFNHDNRWQGQLDVPLDEAGRAQAAVAASSILAFDPVRVVSSDLSRAAATAEALGLPVELDVRLREIHAGEWQGLLRSEIEAGWPEEFAAWRRGDDVRPGGGESRSEAASRAAACMAEFSGEMAGGTLVAVGHGASLRGGMTLLLDLPAGAWQTFEALGNARWADLRRRGDRWVLAAYNGRADLESPPAGRVDSRSPRSAGAAGL